MAQDLYRQFASSAAALSHRCRADFEAGASVADEEIRALSDLAEAVARGVAEWRVKTETLALCRPLDTQRAGRLVLEGVFDEVMEPEAWQVLAGALDLIEVASPGRAKLTVSGEG